MPFKKSRETEIFRSNGIKGKIRKEKIVEERDEAKRKAAEELEKQNGITSTSKQRRKNPSKKSEEPISQNEMDAYFNINSEIINVADFKEVHVEQEPPIQTNNQEPEVDSPVRGVTVETLNIVHEQIEKMQDNKDSKGMITLFGLGKVATSEKNYFNLIASKIDNVVKGLMHAFKKPEKLKMGGSEGKTEIPDEALEQV